MNTPVPRFYVTGGTLRPDTPSYVARRADTDLHAGLSRGEFCYVLTARQMGKSSLMVRTAQRLRAEGIAVAVLDLTAVGQNLSAEQWYGGLLDILGVQLDLEAELGRCWSEHSHLGPLQRWCTALREVVLAEPYRSRQCSSGRLVIFVDEVDAVRSLPFSTDEFFAAMRECYNRRSRDPIFVRLAVCLLGVAAPADLIRDERSTPFDIGRRIELTDFTDAEAAPLALGLRRTGPLGGTLLKRVLYWTGGHPYLTQRLCQAVAEESRAVDPAGVDRLCEAAFLCPGAQERDDNLLFVREQLLRGQMDPARLLLLYAQVRAGKPVRDDERSALVRALRLSGIVRPVDGILAVRNRIYARVFDPQWVAEHAPSVDLWGQRAACRRAAARAVSERERQEALRGMELISSKHLERGVRLLREGDSLGLLELLEARRLEGSARPSGEARSDLWCSSLGASTGRLRGVIGHEGPVFAAAFSPDGKLLATASADETARLWLAEDGTPHGPPLPHQGAVAAVAFSPDGMLLATGSLDGTARLWKTATGQPFGHPFRHEGRVQAVAFSPDGTLLATGASDGSARLWQVGAGRLHDLPLCHQDEVRAVAFSANGRLLATASADRTARLWHTATGEPHGRLLRHPDALGDVAFDRSGTLLASASLDGTARLWEAATGEPRGQPLRHRARIASLAFSPDGTALATGSEDTTAQLWETATGTPLGPPLSHPSHVAAVAFHPDGRLLVTGAIDGAARLWNAASGELQGPPLQHQGSITRIGFRPDGGRLVTASWDGTARLWATSKSPSPVLAPSGPDACRTSRPSGLREMELRTWVTVGARLTAQGTVEAIPWQEWQGLREELRALEACPGRQ